MRVRDLSTDQVRALAVAHVRRYEYRARVSGAGVDVAQYERLLATWRGVLGKVNRTPQWRIALLDAERRALQGAVDSGDYEDLLRATAERPS